MSELTRIILACVTGAISTFFALFFLPFGKTLLGHDRGRKYVEGSEVNIGKPTGVGIYFTMIFVFVCAEFGIHNRGMYLILNIMLLMSLIGFLDDRSKNAWGELSKGILDIVVAFIGSLIVMRFFGTDFLLSFLPGTYYLHPVVYILLATILFIVSINATNATDGVDGLSATVTILTVATLMTAAWIHGTLTLSTALYGAVMIVILIAYLFFNHYPSKVLMGDAGSRAIGFFLAFYFMYLKLPIAYLVLGLPFLIDGGLSILKITIGRLTHKKIIILPKLITPVHDHLKKKLGFSAPKTMLVISLFTLIIDIVYILAEFIVVTR